MEPSYRLHYAPDNASLVIRLALNELGERYSTCLVDRASRAQKSDAYRQLNPNGLIPVLETPNGPVFETAAILLWLVDRHGKLGPQVDDPLRGRFLSWLFFVSNTLHPALRMLFYSSQYIGPAEQDQVQLSGIASEQAVRYFDLLEEEAARTRPVFAATAVSVLDFYVAACLRWAQLYPMYSPHLGRFAPRNWPNLNRMALDLETRQSVTEWRLEEGSTSAPFTRPEYPVPPEGSAV